MDPYHPCIPHELVGAARRGRSPARQVEAQHGRDARQTRIKVRPEQAMKGSMRHYLRSIVAHKLIASRCYTNTGLKMDMCRHNTLMKSYLCGSFPK